MSQAKFDKAVAIVQSLPKDGPIKPTQAEQLFVRLTSSHVNFDGRLTCPRAVLPILQTGLVRTVS